MVVGTIVSLLLVDRVGRRPLLIEGGVQVPGPSCAHDVRPHYIPYGFWSLRACKHVCGRVVCTSGALLERGVAAFWRGDLKRELGVLTRRAVCAQMLAAEVTVAGLLASSGGGLSEAHAAALLAMFCVFAAGFAWSWVRSPFMRP